MTLLKVLSSVTGPIARAWILYGKERIMINPCVVKNITKKN